MSDQPVTKASVQAMLESANAEQRVHIIGHALVVLFDNQTESEKAGNASTVKNSMGFTGWDGKSGCIGAKTYIRDQTLEQWVIDRWMKPDKKGFARICKYWKQLADAAARKSKEEQEQSNQQSQQPSTTTGDLKWREIGAGGKPKPSLFNARLAIMKMGIVCQHDMFRDVTIIGYAGDDVVYEIKPIMGELSDDALLILRTRFSERFGFDPEDKHIRDAVKSLAFDHCFDPIKDLLDEAQGNWDGKKRIDTWVIDYLGCKDTLLNRAIGRKVLVAAARRARDPGCKYDNVAVLEGLEGMDKSTAIRTLAGDKFFSDQSILGASDKEVQEQLSGIWMHESADLTGLKKADVDHVKAFASRQWDRARPAYGHVLVKKPRRGILFATTNDDVYLQSQTGNRRFWPLACDKIDIDALRRDRLQLLGEAAQVESEGESIVLDESLWPDATAEQEKRRVRHPWEDILDPIPEVAMVAGTHIENRIVYREDGGGSLVREMVGSADLLEHVLKVPIGQQQRHHTMTLAGTMKRLGWQRPDGDKVTIDGVRVRGYERLVPGPLPGPSEDELPR